MEVYVIFGPTSTGKTSTAIALAKKTGFPVIVLDRIQCYPHISIGSGRPAIAEVQGTKRVYLAEEALDGGIISAERAHERLIVAVEAHKSEGGLILEGGSISLFKCMAQSSYWNSGFKWHVTRLHLGGEEIFLPAARKRINQMMQLDEQGGSFLGELVSVWKTIALRATLEGICGYRYAIQFARKEESGDRRTDQPEPSSTGAVGGRYRA